MMFPIILTIHQVFFMRSYVFKNIILILLSIYYPLEKWNLIEAISLLIYVHSEAPQAYNNTSHKL